MLEAVFELAKSKIKERKIAVLYFKQIDRELVVSESEKNELSVSVFIDESPDVKESGGVIRTILSQKAKEYYVIICKPFDSVINKWFEANGYKEVSDYLFYSPNPIVLSGNIKKYRDGYGNIVLNLPDNVKITMTGYLSRVEFGINNKFRGSNSIKIDSKAVFKSGKNNVFNKANFELAPKSVFVCGNRNKCGEIGFNITLGKNSSLKMGDASRYVYLRAGTNKNQRYTIGNDVLFANGTYLSHDGHSLFDVLTGERRNYKDTQEEIVIGNHVWIGRDTTVLVPSHIGSGSNIGAQSIVKGCYPNNCSIAGAPGKVVRKNSAWAHEAYAQDMVCACGNSYAIPTIELKKIEDERKRAICKITDIHSYFKLLKTLSNCVVVIAVRDTIGKYFDEDIQKDLSELGVKNNLQGILQRGFLAVINDGHIIYEDLAETQDISLMYECEIEDIKIKTTSEGLECGNNAEIFVGDFNYSVNSRGINLVLFDKESKQVADSVSFDTHVEEIKCLRKISTF